MIEKYYDIACKFVFGHFETSVENDVTQSEETGKDESGNIGEEDNHIDSHKRLLYEKVLARKQSRSKNGTESILCLDKKKKELRNKINKKMEEYREECGELNVLSWLNENGNALYCSLKDKKNGIDFKKIKEHDLIYISKFFDVLEWWKLKESTYPELAVGACIVLGKPTHNAFQERVFSRGTYTDTKLRKQLKEESFEMSVLNAVNSKTIDSYNEMIEEINNKVYSEISNNKKKEEEELMATFNNLRENELKFDNEIIENVSEAEDSSKDEDDVISVCSFDVYDYDIDDNDDDEIFNKVLAIHWEKNNNDNKNETNGNNNEQLITIETTDNKEVERDEASFF